LRNKIVELTLIVIVLASVPLFALANASSIEQTHVNSGAISTIALNLQSKQRVTGSFNISSGNSRDKNIDFSVRDPLGAIILDSGRVVRGENFSFTAENDGEYTLTFDNSFSGTRKNIQLEYDVSSPPILGFDPIVFSGIVIATGVVLAIIGFAVYRNQAKRRTTQIPPLRQFSLSFEFKLLR